MAKRSVLLFTTYVDRGLPNVDWDLGDESTELIRALSLAGLVLSRDWSRDSPYFFSPYV